MTSPLLLITAAVAVVFMGSVTGGIYTRWTQRRMRSARYEYCTQLENQGHHWFTENHWTWRYPWATVACACGAGLEAFDPKLDPQLEADLHEWRDI